MQAISEKRFPKALVIGADGLIGGALLADLSRRGWQVVGTTRKKHCLDPARIHLDLGRAPADAALAPGFEAVAVCAGITRLTDCEKDPSGSWQVNVAGTVRIVASALKQGAFVVFLSSNLVFDGSAPYALETGATAPRTIYGYQKAETETRILNLEGRTAILRMTKVVAPGAGLPSEWRKALQARQAIYPYADLMMAPVPLDLAVQVLRKMMELKTTGIFHLSGNRDLSYAEAARIGARALGSDPTLVKPVEMPLAMRRTAPRFTTLDVRGCGSVFDCSAPVVERTIQQVFRGEQTNDP